MAQPKTRILIVEDENIIALDIKRTLIKLGYNPIATVSTGEKALEITRKEKPEVILMDINLKGALNGIEAAKAIALEYNIPIIFLSALNFHIKDKVKAAGHLIKPFEERELKDAIVKALSTC